MLKSQPFLKLGVKLSINHLYHTLQKSEPSVRGTAFITCLEDYFRTLFKCHTMGVVAPLLYLPKEACLGLLV